MNPILDAALRGAGLSRPVATNNSASDAARQAAEFAASNDGLITPTYRSAGYLDPESRAPGTALNPQAQLGLFTKIRQTGSWLKYITVVPTTEQSGSIELYNDDGFRMVPTSRAGPRVVPISKPDLDTRTFSTSTMSGAFGLRLKALGALRRGGVDPQTIIQRGVAAGVANVFADLGINGDTSLPADTDQNIMRRTSNGWFKRMRQFGTNHVGLADGFSYHNGIWPGMLDMLDEAYRSSPAIAWGCPDRLSTRWLTELTRTRQGGDPSIINDFGAGLLNAAGSQARPLGKPTVVIPQISTQQWGTEGYTGMAPTSVSDNGDGTLTINVNTLAGSGVNRGSAGADGQRYVTVWNTATGKSETLAIAFSTPNNTVTTTTILGQSAGAASTTAADYAVRWADLTSLALGSWRHCCLVIQDGIRVYTVFHERDELLEVIVHADVDFPIVDPLALALTDDIISPRFSVLPTT